MTNDNKGVTVVEEKAELVPMVFNEQQIQLIKNTVARGVTNDELSLFLYTCKRTGLDPLIKQIYAVKRNTKNGPVMGIQTGIDGYRLIAERTGKYAPGKEPSYREDGDKLISATAYVNKLVGGTWHEVAATAYYNEYRNDTNPIWQKMPRAMLSKCAESLCLRRAFPAEMSGVYTHEEMEQADVVTVTPVQEPERIPARDGEVSEEQVKAAAERAKSIFNSDKPVKVVPINPAKPEIVNTPQDNGFMPEPPPGMRFISEAQRKRLFAILHKSKAHTEDELKAYMEKMYKITDTKHILMGDMYNDIIDFCELPSK